MVVTADDDAVVVTAEDDGDFDWYGDVGFGLDGEGLLYWNLHHFVLNVEMKKKKKRMSICKFVNLSQWTIYIFSTYNLST